MPRSFKDIWPPKDLVSAIRLGAAVLLVFNLIAVVFVVRPPGGSAQELRSEAIDLRNEVRQREAALARTRDIAGKVQAGRTEAESFMNVWFLDRRILASTVVADLVEMGREAGLRQKESSYTTDPVDGAEDLSMLTVSVNYEGTYANLMKLLNEIDRSKRLIIVESLQAAPQQGSNVLNINVRLNGFVRDNASGPLPKFVPETQPEAVTRTAQNFPPGGPVR